MKNLCHDYHTDHLLWSISWSNDRFIWYKEATLVRREDIEFEISSSCEYHIDCLPQIWQDVRFWRRYYYSTQSNPFIYEKYRLELWRHTGTILKPAYVMLSLFDTRKMRKCFNTCSWHRKSLKIWSCEKECAYISTYTKQVNPVAVIILQ